MDLHESLYIELQKYQNLVSIVGPGNIKLARAMAKEGMLEAPKQHVSEIRREIERTNALKG